MSTNVETKLNDDGYIPQLDTTKINTDIRNAYLRKDAQKSRELHERKMQQNNEEVIGCDESSYVIEVPVDEGHKPGGGYVKSMIYGGLDGIITTFAIVAGIAGANLGTDVILTLGFANLIADAISMGIGNYLSEKTEMEHIASEREREEWEFENFKEGEIQEMIQIYREKGVSKADAEKILRTMSKYRDFFINHMMIQELELYSSYGPNTLFKGGFVTVISFVCFGCVPLLSFVILEDFEIDADSYDPRFLISVLLTVFTLCGLGIFKGKLTDSSRAKSGFFVTFNGVLAAGAAYLIAFTLSHLIGIHG